MVPPVRKQIQIRLIYRTLAYWPTRRIYFIVILSRDYRTAFAVRELNRAFYKRFTPSCQPFYPAFLPAVFL